MISAEGQRIAEGQKINVRGVPHYYEWVRQPNDRTAKPVIVFIHGWGGSARYWYGTARSLSQHFDCLLYDLRGFGRSSLPVKEQNRSLSLLSYELEEYATDLAIFLDALGLDSIYLNAHSMGASVATLFLNRYAERVKRAILNCSGIFEYDEKAFAAFYKFSRYVVKFRYNWFLKIPLADKVFMARFLNQPIPRKLSRAFLEDFLLADPEAALETIYTCVNQKAVEFMPKEFARLAVPTLLISGAKDRIIPPEMGRQAAALNKKIEYVAIANTGHFPMLEDARTYLAKVREFLGVV
jgi:pimeloyl-ACP methyl ester carboxylesterase